MNTNATGSNPNQPKGKLIVIEGGDSAGKHTQANLLNKHLKLKGHRCELISFPQYDTPFGELVARYLRGEYGALDELSPEIPCLLYALDRYQTKDTLDKALNDGVWFVADRYTQSNFGFQGAKFGGEEQQRFIQWIEALEARLPQPDLVFYLYVPVELSQNLMKDRKQKKYLKDGTKQDIHELDIDYQQRVVDTYMGLAKTKDNWVLVDCVDKKTNKIRTIERIHREIVQVINDRLGL
jgi:dTMP kinase